MNTMNNMSKLKTTTVNGKHQAKTTLIRQVTDPVNSRSGIKNILVIQETLQKYSSEEQKIRDIKQCVCDLQSQIYYSRFQQSNKKCYKEYYKEQDNQNNDQKPYEISLMNENISLGKRFEIKNKFMQKLYEYQNDKRSQLEKIAQQKEQNQKSQGIDLLDELMNEKNQEIKQQVYNLYKVLNKKKKKLNEFENDKDNMKKIDQNQYGVVILKQNCHPKYNLLLHSSSIIQSIFCYDYEQNQILDFPKFVYINLTGSDTKENLGLWMEFNYYYQNFCQYFTFQNENIKNSKLSNRQTVIPCENKIISEHEMKLIYNLYIRNKLNQLKPAIIYIDICNTESFSISLTALNKLVGKLRQFCKVILYIQFDPNHQNLQQSSLEYLRTLNACLFGLQKCQNIGRKDSCIKIKANLEELIKFVDNTIINYQKVYRKENLKVNYLQIQKFCYKKKIKKFEDLLSQFKFILIGEKQNYIIDSEDNKGKKIQFERVLISYQHKIIILLDFNNQKFYYHQFNNDLTTQVQDQSKNQNTIILCFTEFQKNTSFYEKMINAIVIINKQQILFAYPIIKNQVNVKQNNNLHDNWEKNEDIILSYCLKQHNWQIINRNQKAQVDSGEEYFESKYKTETLIKQLREYSIVGQTVCYQPHNQNQESLNDYQIYSLFGGEIINSFTPMNLIEYLFVNIENNYFFSKFIRRLSNPYLGSLKPSPYQLVLPIKNIQQLGNQNEISCAYLILRPFNQTKNNFYETMLNPQNLKKAQLAIYYFNKNLNIEHRTIYIDIKYKVSKESNYRLNILEIMNEDWNFIEIENQNETKSQINQTQWQWKAVYTNYLQIRNPKYLTKKTLQENVKKINQIANGTIVSLEFTISLKQKQKKKSNQNYANDQTQVVQSEYSQDNDEVKLKQSNKEIAKMDSAMEETIFQNPSSQDSSAQLSAATNPPQKHFPFNFDNWFVQTEIFWDWNLETS